jgi:hypothetical protein
MTNLAERLRPFQVAVQRLHDLIRQLLGESMKILAHALAKSIGVA